MSPLRRYGIPAGSALGVTLTGCGGELPGEWLLLERGDTPAAIDETREEPYGTYSYFYEVGMSVARDLSGWMTYSYGASYDSVDRSYDYDFAWRFPLQARASSGRAYQIVLDGDRGALGCLLTDGALACEDDQGLSWRFEPR